MYIIIVNKHSVSVINMCTHTFAHACTATHKLAHTHAHTGTTCTTN